MNLRDHLQTLEERLLEPRTRHNAIELERLLVPEFIEFGSSGRTFTRAQILAELAAEPPDTHLALYDFRLVASSPTPDPDWALVTYRSTRTTSAGSRSALRSSTWILRDGRWQILFHQGTLRQPEPQP